MKQDAELAGHPAVTRRNTLLLLTTFLYLIVEPVIIIAMVLLPPAGQLGPLMAFSISAVVTFSLIYIWLYWWQPRNVGQSSYSKLAEQSQPIETKPEWISALRSWLADCIRRLDCRQPKIGLIGSVYDEQAKPSAWMHHQQRCIYMHKLLVERDVVSARFALGHELGHWAYTLPSIRLYEFNRLLCYLVTVTVLSAAVSATGYSLYFTLFQVVPFDQLWPLYLACFPLLLLIWLPPFLHIWFVHADEYMADAIGAELLGDKEQAAEALLRVCSHQNDDGVAQPNAWSFTHPSTKARVKVICNRLS